MQRVQARVDLRNSPTPRSGDANLSPERFSWPEKKPFHKNHPSHNKSNCVGVQAEHQIQNRDPAPRQQAAHVLVLSLSAFVHKDTAESFAHQLERRLTRLCEATCTV